MDWTFGGMTLIVHIEGTTRPRSPNEPEYIKADIYFPGHMIREVPYTSKVVSDIVQHFIHNIGIPTIERFNRCAKLLWNMPLYSGPIPAPYPIQTTSPNASPPGSSVFTYYGRPNWAVVQDVDSDFNSDALRTQFEQVHQSIKRAEDVWANSHQPEQPLGSLFPPPITPANIRTMPRTPESTLSSDSSQYDFISPIGTPSRYKSVSSSPSISLTACGAGGSQAWSAVTPKRASRENIFFFPSLTQMVWQNFPLQLIVFKGSVYRTRKKSETGLNRTD